MIPIPTRYMKGKAIQAASRRVAQRKVTGGTPITSSASISSEIRIAPSSATIPGPDLGREHVAEGVGHDLAQVAPGGEDAGVGGSALGAQQVGALDPALQAEDEDEAPDDQRRAEDQDAGLAQALAEEAEDAAGVDEAGDA